MIQKMTQKRTFSITTLIVLTFFFLSSLGLDIVRANEYSNENGNNESSFALHGNIKGNIPVGVKLRVGLINRVTGNEMVSVLANEDGDGKYSLSLPEKVGKEELSLIGEDFPDSRSQNVMVADYDVVLYGDEDNSGTFDKDEEIGGVLDAWVSFYEGGISDDEPFFNGWNKAGTFIGFSQNFDDEFDISIPASFIGVNKKASKYQTNNDRSKKKSILVVKKSKSRKEAKKEKAKKSEKKAPPLRIVPKSKIIELGDEIAFEAIAKDPEADILWAIDNDDGTLGEVDEDGIYISPDVMPKAKIITVRAYLVNDESVFALAKVKFKPVVVKIIPTSATVPVNENTIFSEIVTGTFNTDVIWYVNNIEGGNENVGIIDYGVYTAPSTVPSPSKVKIKAVSVVDTSKSATAEAIVVNSLSAKDKILFLKLSGPKQILIGATETITASAKTKSKKTIPPVGIEYFIDDETIASIVTNDDGTASITGLSEGSVEVIGSTEEKDSSPLKIDVVKEIKSEADSLMISGPSYLTVGSNAVITASAKNKKGNFLPISNVSYSSDNTNIISVKADANGNGFVNALAVGEAKITATSGNLTSNTLKIKVTESTGETGAIASLKVFAPSVLPVGVSAPLNVLARDANGKPVPPIGVNYVSSNTSVATTSVDASGSGNVSAIAEGETQITAELGTVKSDPVTLKVVGKIGGGIGGFDQIAFINLQVPPSMEINQTLPIFVNAKNSYGMPVPTAGISYSSSDTNIVTVKTDYTNNPVITANSQGEADITASVGTIQGKAHIVVKAQSSGTSADVAFLDMPYPPPLNVGQTFTVFVMARNSFGMPMPVPFGIEYSSEDTSKVSVSKDPGNNLVLNAQAETPLNPVKVVAKINGAEKASIMVKVNPLPTSGFGDVAFLDMPYPPPLNVGQTYTVFVNARNQYGMPMPVPFNIEYSSDNPAVVTISKDQGFNAVLYGAGAGETDIHASVKKSDGSVVMANAVHVKVAATSTGGGQAMFLDMPFPPPLTVGQTFTLFVKALDQSGKSVSLAGIAYTTDKPAVVSVSSDFANNAVLTGMGAGTANITATLGTLTKTVTVTVNTFTGGGGQIAFLDIMNPPPPTMKVGEFFQLIVMARSQYGMQVPLGPGSILYTSSNSGVASVMPDPANNGNINAIGQGEADITAALATNTSISKTVHISVIQSTGGTSQVAFLDIPFPPPLNVGQSFTLFVTARDMYGKPVPATGITYSSDNLSIVGVVPDFAGNAILNALSAGKAKIKAVLGNIFKEIEVTVNQPTGSFGEIASLFLPSMPPVFVGQQFVMPPVTAKDATGMIVPASGVKFESGDTSKAMVFIDQGGNGVIFGVSAGTANITASIDTPLGNHIVSNVVQITVVSGTSTGGAVAFLEISGPPSIMTQGTVAPLAVKAKDSTGAQVPPPSGITYEKEPAGIIDVFTDSTGFTSVKAIGAGTATLKAISGSITSNILTILVQGSSTGGQTNVASLQLQGPSSIKVNEQANIQVIAKDSFGNIVPPPTGITFNSNSPAIAEIVTDSFGNPILKGKTVGNASITATLGTIVSTPYNVSVVSETGTQGQAPSIKGVFVNNLPVTNANAGTIIEVRTSFPGAQGTPTEVGYKIGGIQAGFTIGGLLNSTDQTYSVNVTIPPSGVSGPVGILVTWKGVSSQPFNFTVNSTSPQTPTVKNNTLLNHFSGAGNFDFSTGAEVTLASGQGDLEFAGIPSSPELRGVAFDGGILDAGVVTLTQMTTPPTTGFAFNVIPVANHGYWVKTTEGKFAKLVIKVLNSAPDASGNATSVNFEWVFMN
ncbi:MAG: hypothetical protein A3H37_01965 [Candidatus Schekmanbacteria bacterium RIFCSPLOWO2_02_FULL_38_14]|nr:MAG: hypothetical protein A3H37_01965 [Candidatus Schekmanbacteria bacterium RIFCSPLOWO2_02_FULL_38_14]